MPAVPAAAYSWWSRSRERAGVVRTTVDVIQLVLNLAAVVGGAVVWKLYVGNLKAAKSVVEERRDFWKDKAAELEKRTPEAVEALLTKRIEIRDGELARLAQDRDANAEQLLLLEQEKRVLERTLGTTKGFREMLALEGEEDPGDDAPPVPDIEVVLMGEVGVDSGQLLITDPCYIDSSWAHEDYTGEPVAPGAPGAPGPSYSYNGACQASMDKGYGELVYPLGHTGAGVAFSTAFGDGVYPVYGEMHDGRIERVYVNVG